MDYKAYFVLEAGQISNFLKEDIQLILVFNITQGYR